MKYGSKGMSCAEFVNLMRERGYTYDSNTGRFITGHGKVAGKETHSGYRTLMLQKDKVQYTFCEHRCVWTWFNGDIPDGYEINHIDAIRTNNRIENLKVVTHKENMQHMKRIGHVNTAKAEMAGRSIYSNKEVQTMRYLRGKGWSLKQIASLFGNKNTNVIGRLINGRRYASVTEDLDIFSIFQIVVSRAVDLGVEM